MPDTQTEALITTPDQGLLAYKWKAMITVALGTMMGTMDSSITNISFPILTRAFGVELTTIVWVTLAFILTSTSLLLVLGRVGDLFGRKRIYISGNLIFTLGLTLCSLSQNVTQLIIFRVFQALGAAMLISCGAAIVTEAFPERERGKGLGFLAVSVSAGLISGPALGGFLLGWLHWRAIFYVRIPIGLLVLFLGIVFLKPDKRRAGKVRFDLLGTLFVSLGLACLIIGINQLNRFGLKSPMFSMLMFLGILSLIAFVFVEKRAPDPIVDLSLLKNRVFSSALWALFLIFFTYSAYILLMPFYLLQGIAMPPSKAGVVLTMVSVIAIIIGPISGWLSDRFGQARFAILGAVITIISFWVMQALDLDSRLVLIISAQGLAGLGMGLFQSPNNSSIMGSVSEDRLGTASAMTATFRQMGVSLGMAMSGTIYSARLIYYKSRLIQQGLQEAMVHRQAVSHSFSDAFLVSAILMSSVLVLSIMTRKPKSLV